MEAKPERLQKILAAAGLASRRKAEELIAAGVVSVNGHTVTEPGTKADPRIDEIRVDGKLLRGPERHVYLAMYKPKGHMTTVSDPEGRPTVMDLLKGVEERVFPIGRLDYMSEGLLLLTNDGDLMAELTKAGSHVAKTYMVKVSGKPTDDAIDKLRNGIMLPPEPGLTGVRGKKQPGTERRSFAVLTQPAVIQLAVDQENPWFEVTLTEGRNRQLRRMFEQIGHHIEKIKRVRYGSLTLDLEPGEFRHMTPKEVTQLRKSLETPFKPKVIKVKRKDDRPERKPRIDTARFVKGRRGKPSADGVAPAASAGRDTTRSTAARPAGGYGAAAERRPFIPRTDAGSPRGPEFGRESVRREEGFAAKRTYVRKPAGEFPAKAGAGFEERPKRAYKAGGFDGKPGGFARKPGSKPAGEFAKREGGRAGGYVKAGYVKAGYTKRAPFKREGAGAEGGFREGSHEVPAKREGASGSFGFAKFNKPKFVKPSKHRDLGSDKTDNFKAESFERKPFSAERPYSKERGAGAAGSYGKKPGSYTPRPGGDRKFSKGPGKPGGYAPRAGGDFKRPGGEFKPRAAGGEFKRPGGDYKPRVGEFKPRAGDSDFNRPSGDFKPRTGGSGFKRSGEGRPGGGRPSGGGRFGAPRGASGSTGAPPRSGGAGYKRSGPGASGRPGGGRPGSGPRSGGAPRPPRRHDD